MIMKSSSSTMNETPHFFSLSIAGKTYMLGSVSDDNRTKWMMFIKNITVRSSSNSSSYMYVCMYVCIYVSIYLCIYVFNYLCIYMYKHTYIYIYVCTYAWLYVEMTLTVPSLIYRNQKSATSTRGSPVCYL